MFTNEVAKKVSSFEQSSYQPYSHVAGALAIENLLRTVEGSHVHGDGGNEALALVELPLQQLAEHVQGDELVAVQDGALREGAATQGMVQ